MKALVEVSDVDVEIDGRVIIRALSFSLADGGIGCLLGPSGSGKTSLLRCLAGIEKVKRGRIVLDGRTVNSKTVHCPPEQLSAGMVFQDYQLFPHLNVKENIEFGIRKNPRRERSRRLDKLLEMIGLSGYERRYPHELSGGKNSGSPWLGR